MWVDYRGSHSTVYNDENTSTHVHTTYQECHSSRVGGTYVTTYMEGLLMCTNTHNKNKGFTLEWLQEDQYGTEPTRPSHGAASW